MHLLPVISRARAKRAARRRCADLAADAGGISCRVAIAIVGAIDLAIAASPLSSTLSRARGARIRWWWRWDLIRDNAGTNRTRARCQIHIIPSTAAALYPVFSLYLSKAFFPVGDARLLDVAGIFALGFVMRPIGSWLLGS